jgi:hypothetical protein
MPTVSMERKECPLQPISQEADGVQCPGLPLPVIFGCLAEKVMESQWDRAK